jgi:hypothetical protein
MYRDVKNETTASALKGVNINWFKFSHLRGCYWYGVLFPALRTRLLKFNPCLRLAGLRDNN